MVLANLVSHWLSLVWSFITATVVIFSIGIFLSRKFFFRGEMVKDWQQSLALLLVFLFLFGLFLKINQGLAIFDENYNLPIVSRIAADDVPPHFPFDPSQPLAYHYGLHLIAGIAVRLGGLSPWSAFDAVRAFTHALMLILAFLWFERKTQSFWTAVLGTGVTYFGGSTQWLLLLAPQNWIEKLNSIIALSNTALNSGTNLYEVLVKNWNIDGLGVVSLPFAFIGGIFKPQNLALTSNGAAVALTIFLLLLLEPKRWQITNTAILSLLLASLALTAEYLLGLMLIGMGLVALFMALRERYLSPLVHFAALWIPASGFALLAGGVISVMVIHDLGLKSDMPYNTHGSLAFEVLLPPSLPTLYFGRLSLFKIDTLLFSIILLGPLIVLIPLSLTQLRTRTAPLQLIQHGMLSGAAVCILLSLVVGIEDSLGAITRLLDTALLVILILSFPLLHYLWEKRSQFLQTLIALSLIILSMGGIVTFGLQLLAAARPQSTVYIDGLDTRFYNTYWDHLSSDAQIFDPNPPRSIVLFGRSVGSIAADYGRWLPDWQQLLTNPTPLQLIQKGYTHAYLDKRFWNSLTDSTKSDWEQGCASLIEVQTLDSDFRRLYDLQGCR